MMGNESHTTRDLLNATRRRWDKLSDVWPSECKKTRAGLHQAKGSENIAFMAWAAAFVVWRMAPHLLPYWMSTNEPPKWWTRELMDRRDHGLFLKEVRSRIYPGWHWVSVAAVYAFAEGQIRQLARDWMRCYIAMCSLCAVNVKPRRYDPPLDAKLAGGPPFVPICGARSWSAEQADSDPDLEAHHMGSSAYESILGAILFDDWSPAQPAHTYELDVMQAAGAPDLFGRFEKRSLRRAVVNPRDLDRAELLPIVEMAVWSRPAWGCYLARWNNGGTCIGYGRGMGVSTDAVYTMAIHDDGTIHYLVTGTGARHGINYEPCGMDFDAETRNVVAWAGGEDEPKQEMTFPQRRWGNLLWLVKIAKRGADEIVYQRSSETEPNDPPSPEPPEEPSEEERRCDDWPGVLRWLCRLFVRLTD